MGWESLPLVVFLLLPGFLSWFIFCWGTVVRKINQLQHLFISLILSILAFTLAYYLTYLFKFAAVNIFNASWDITSFPGYMEILGEPRMLPLELGIAIYVLAIALGFLLIRIYRSEGVAKLLNRVGLDLYAYEDTWYRLFHKADYVTVYLKDGNIVAGWPTYFSQTGDRKSAELYLSKMHYYNKEKKHWVKSSRSVDGLLINADSISHIEFRNPELAALKREDSSSVEGGSTSHILGRMDYLRMGIALYSFGLILCGIRGWISAYSVAGLVFIFLSLVFMACGLWEKPRNTISSFIERQRNPLIKSFPKFFEWYIMVTLFAVGLASSLARLTQEHIAFFIALYSIGIIWMFISLIQLRLSLRQKRGN